MANTFNTGNYVTQEGTVHFTALPTSAPSGSGQLWNDGGTLKIAPVHVFPANTVAPAITGTAKVGETLTVTKGTWTATPTATYSRQWLADGVAISGATATTYQLTGAEEGSVITVRVTATNVVGVADAVSNATAAVEAA